MAAAAVAAAVIVAATIVAAAAAAAAAVAVCVTEVDLASLSGDYALSTGGMQSREDGKGFGGLVTVSIYWEVSRYLS